MAEKFQAGRGSSYLGTIDSERLDRFLKFLPAITIVVTLVAFVVFVFTYKERQTSHAYIVRSYESQLEGQPVTVEGITVLAFLGIPFAQSTGGNNRFRRPVPAAPPLTLQANQKGPPCVQKALPGSRGSLGPRGPYSEDCLHLNVWVPQTPAKEKRDKKAVLIFLYGYNFQNGANNYDSYDGSYLAALGDVIVVVPNYRLSIFGFLMAGTQEEPGNLGLLDQKLALDWVRYNIGYFGGDEDNITLWGVDAGAASIAMHMLSPHAYSLQSMIKRLILHSSSMPHADNTRMATQNIMTVSKQLNCGEGPLKQILECLRSTPVHEFLRLDLVQNDTFVPSFDSEYLPDKPFSLAAKVPISRKQVLLGNVEDEGAYTVYCTLDRERGKPSPEELLQRLIPNELSAMYGGVRNASKMFPAPGNDSDAADPDAIATGTPNDPHGQLLGTAAHLVGDFDSVCPSQYFAHYLSSGRGSKVYMYLLNHKPSYSLWPETNAMTRYEDVDMIFGRPLHLTHARPEERRLSRQLIQIWTTFAKTGKLPPVKYEGGEEAEWPTFSRSHVGNSVVEITAVGLRVIPNAHKQHCAQLLPIIGKGFE